MALALTVVACGSEGTTESKTSTSTSTPTSTSTATATSTATSPTPGAHAMTVAEYISQNNIKETSVHPGDPGSPTINLPLPAGWHRLPETAAPYYGIACDQAADPNDPPTVSAIVAKLEGNVDPAKILEYAPNDLKTLPGFEGGTSNGKESTLGGFQAWQFGGSYDKNGKRRMAAQKTVVINSPNGLYVLELDADSVESEADKLMDATSTIDEQTTITP
ncbi:hypothetical protein BST27_23865 [Mycobacterium intermedium]|uniref:Lipoprotein LpqN n=1 Tax=Mycobacterium intermedium TaxID=28445 RepID=A0A1T3W7D4_MYCIE|nr:hypothetical protein BV508_11360 [Mycobacterium intermedium]ORA96871.1 hypothetical protein BST27_23865 [Mycobacterium intermedium]